MRDFIKVVDFDYCFVPYTMFIDNKDRYFFMKRDNDGYYHYTTFEEQKTLLSAFCKTRRVMNIKTGEKMRMTPKILMGMLLVTMTLNMFSGCVKAEDIKVTGFDGQELTYTIDNSYLDKFDYYDNITTSEDYDYTKDFEIDTYVAFPGAGDRVLIYDSAFYDDVLGTNQASVDDFYRLIDANRNIPDRLKPLFKEYCYNYVTLVPNADRRVLYNNLQTLKVKECTPQELMLETFSSDSCACYYPEQNTIITLKDYKFEKGTWEYQVLFHEISHAARISYFSKNGKNYEIKSGGLNYNVLLLDEALNTMFSIKVLGYDENDFAYQLQSNYLNLILNSMDNYDIADYINHSQSYFIKKLNEYLNQSDYANAMIELLQMQYDDFHDDYLHVDQNSYYPLYDFMSEIYYKNRIVPGMSYEEALEVKNEFVSKVIFDVSSGYEIDLVHFDEFFNEYCARMGIEVIKQSL